jgi:hypothetical protein
MCCCGEKKKEMHAGEEKRGKNVMFECESLSELDKWVLMDLGISVLRHEMSPLLSFRHRK